MCGKLGDAGEKTRDLLQVNEGLGKIQKYENSFFFFFSKE